MINNIKLNIMMEKSFNHKKRNTVMAMLDGLYLEEPRKALCIFIGLYKYRDKTKINSNFVVRLENNGLFLYVDQLEIYRFSGIDNPWIKVIMTDGFFIKLGTTNLHDLPHLDSHKLKFDIDEDFVETMSFSRGGRTKEVNRKYGVLRYYDAFYIHDNEIIYKKFHKNKNAYLKQYFSVQKKLGQEEETNLCYSKYNVYDDNVKTYYFGDDSTARLLLTWIQTKSLLIQEVECRRALALNDIYMVDSGPQNIVIRQVDSFFILQHIDLDDGNIYDLNRFTEINDEMKVIHFIFCLSQQNNRATSLRSIFTSVKDDPMIYGKINGVTVYSKLVSNLEKVLSNKSDKKRLDEIFTQFSEDICEFYESIYFKKPLNELLKKIQLH